MKSCAHSEYGRTGHCGEMSCLNYVSRCSTHWLGSDRCVEMRADAVQCFRIQHTCGKHRFEVASATRHRMSGVPLGSWDAAQGGPS